MSVTAYSNLDFVLAEVARCVGVSHAQHKAAANLTRDGSLPLANFWALEDFCSYGHRPGVKVRGCLL